MNKGMIITILCTVAITIISTNALAVDGYKNLKFGMSIEEVIESLIYMFKEEIPEEIWTTNSC